MKTLFKNSLLFFIVMLISCRNEQTEQKNNLLQYQETEKITPNDIETITPEEAKTYHKNNNYEYEYRTGYSGSYEYNYDVNGYDEDGNEVTGNINMEGKYGAGILTNSEGEDVDVEVEWFDYGKLKAVDDDGNEYELEVD